jgi:hypothetical protein
MKVIVAGSRDFNNFAMLWNNLDHILKGENDVTIISGCARGADNMGIQYAVEKGYDVIRMPADWDKHGRSAGYIRNVDMARIADMCVVFWDGTSRGTGHMIDICRERKIPCHVIKFK